MGIKSADPQTIAPRLSIVEDQAAWLLENRGTGGGGGTDPSELLKKLYQATVGLSHTSIAAPGDDIWDGNVYTDDNGERSMHVAIFGWSPDRKDLANVEACLQNAKGFYSMIFARGDARWLGFSASLANDIYGPDDQYLGSLRTSGRSLVEAVFGDPSSVPGPGPEGTVMGRIEQLEAALEELATNFEEALADLRDNTDAQLASIVTEIDNIKTRMAAAGI